jgi:hypothetical protein
MKKILLITAVFVSMLFQHSHAEWNGRLELILGSKSLDAADWGIVKDQREFGLQLDMKKQTWPVWLTAGFLKSQDKATIVLLGPPDTTRQIEGGTTEIHGGIKKDFHPSHSMRLSLSGGPAWVRAHLDQSSAPFSRDKGTGLGYWATADVLVFFNTVGVGFSYRISKADIDLHGRNRDAGGRHLVFSAGLAW